MGDHYLLNGTKNWITNGTTASVYLVIAQTHPEKKHRGINVLIVDKDMPGFVQGPKENKLGIRGSDTCSLMFTDVKVPKENRIGDDGFGFKFAMQVLAGGRIGIAAQALGIASGSLELSLKYAKERKAFGVPISQHQAIQFKLADMATNVDAARLLCLQAAADKDNDAGLCQVGRHGQALRLESSDGLGRRGRADSRRLRLCEGIPRRALHARCQNHPDL